MLLGRKIVLIVLHSCQLEEAVSAQLSWKKKKNSKI